MNQYTPRGALATSLSVIDPGILKLKMKSSKFMEVTSPFLGHYIFSIPLQFCNLAVSLAFANHFALPSRVSPSENSQSTLVKEKGKQCS